MFAAKAVLPALLWLSLLWFLVTGRIMLPIRGLVKREEETSLYVFLLFLNLAIAATFTKLLFET